MNSKNTIEQFDMIVIGAGTGGIGVARPCVKAGWKVAIIDEEPYGGTCMLRGCDPKKMLIGVTEGVDAIERMKNNGLEVDRVKMDWSKMMTFKETFTEVMAPKLEKGLSRMGMETLHGNARFNDDGVLLVGDRKIQGKYYHIATGAKPMKLQIKGEEYVSTSTDFLEMKDLPERVVFLGGGFIGFEFSHIIKRSGAKEVAIIHRSKQVLKNFDPDLVEMQIQRTRELGVDIKLETIVTEIVKVQNGYRLTIKTPNGTDFMECDMVVHSAGRVPNIDTLNLEAIGVKTSPLGIEVSKHFRSVSNPNVFSVGDCANTGAPNLTPISANEARVAAKNILAKKDVKTLNYPPIPSVIFTLPPIATVGLSEKEATNKGLSFDVKFNKTKNWYSSLRVGEKFSGYKILVEKETGKILGAHILGPGTEEQINVIAMAMGQDMTANQIKGVIFAYPSYSSDIASMV